MTDLAVRPPVATTALSATAPSGVQVSPSTPPPVWFFRYNPFSRKPIRDERLATALCELSAADQAVEAATEEVSARLHARIGATEDPQERKRLIAVRRAVHRGKALPEGEQTPEVVAWAQARAARDEVLERVLAMHEEAMATERRVLSKQLGDPALRASLEVVAPEVARQAGRYREAVGETGRAAARVLKSERGLLQYVFRAAMRTSPLARLTAVGLTSPKPGGDHPDHPTMLSERSFFGLDRVMLDYVVGGLEEAAGLHARGGHVCLPPTSAVADGQLMFLRPTGQGYQRAAVPLTPPLAQLVAALGMGPVPQDALVDILGHSTGLAPEAAAGMIRKAAAAGLVCTTRPTTDSDLVDLGPRGEPSLDSRLEELRTQLTGLAAAPVVERRGRMDRLETDLERLSRDSGRPARIAVNEDSIVRLGPVDPQAWGQALADLGPAVELLATFDWLADVSVGLVEVFVARHGSGGETNLVEAAPDLVADLTAFAERMTAAYTDPAADEDELARLAGGDRTLARLFTLRRRIEAVVDQRFADAIRAGADEAVLEPEEVHELLAALPSRLRERPLGYGVLVQSWEGGLVVNDGLPGHGMLFSRFLGMDRATGGDTVSALRDRVLARYGEPGVEVVEDRSHHGLNVNVHPPVLPQTLEAGDWPRLRLVHDRATGRLQVRDGDRVLKVLPIGGGHPGLYPPALSVASGLTIAGRLYNGLPDVLALHEHADPEQTRALPRMRVGTVVISRRRWYPGSDLQEALAVPDDRDRLVALTRWRARHGVPAEVMIKSVPADSGPASAGAPEAQSLRFKAKPQYVDLTSALCARVLPRMLERRLGPDSPAMYIEEATPGITASAHAAEWVVEVDRPAGGRFSYGGES